MKLSLFKKVCLTVMGVGVVSSLVSVGTFATFTATSTNPGNTFAAGTLLISTVSNSQGNTFSTSGTVSGNAGPNISGTSSVTSGSDCTKVVLSACSTVLSVNNVTSQGLEPGQFAQAQFHIKNTGTLAGAMSVQVENVATTVNAAGGGAGSFDVCPTDIATAGGATGQGAACVALGNGLNITLQTNGGTSGGTQCVYGQGGNATGGTYSPNAPTVGHTDFALQATACDNITTATANATNGLSLKPDNIALAGCGPSPNFCAGDPFTKFVTALAGVGSNGVWINGSQAAATFTTPSGSSAKRWAPGEDQTFTLTIAFPDQGAKSTTIGSNNVSVGFDSIFQGGQVKFDLVWYLQQ